MEPQTQAEGSDVNVPNTMEQGKRVLSHLGVWSFPESLGLDQVWYMTLLPPQQPWPALAPVTRVPQIQLLGTAMTTIICWKHQGLPPSQVPALS